LILQISLTLASASVLDGSQWLAFPPSHPERCPVMNLAGDVMAAEKAPIMVSLEYIEELVEHIR
jgi:hypothetical protein